MRLWIEIKGDIDSLSLWKLLKSYNVNLTYLGDKSLIYGDALEGDIGAIVSACASYGDIEAKICKGGAMNEQKKEKEDKPSI